MGYIDNNLGPGERIIHTATLARWATISSFIWLIVGLLVLAASWPIGLLIMLAAAYNILRIRNTEIALTNKRVIIKTGVVSRKVDECPVYKINNISVDQGMLGRLMNYGNVMVQTAAEAGAMKLKEIEDPFAFKKALNNAMDVRDI